MKILQIGNGAMGKLLAANLEKENELLVCSRSGDIPLKESFDLVVDFSHASNLNGIYDYLSTTPTPLVLATTGYDEDQVEKIHELGKQMPVLFSGNFSIGLNLMQRLIREMNGVLTDFDIEIIEKHHHFKVDAPSGTAKMLFDTLAKDREIRPVYGRQGMSPLQAGEVGIHSLRTGTIVGEHEVIFGGEDEVLSIKHQALSKMIFVNGAIRASKWLLNQEIGLYSMQDVLFGGDR